jgi:hypothetical protein
MPKTLYSDFEIENRFSVIPNSFFKISPDLALFKSVVSNNHSTRRFLRALITAPSTLGEGSLTTYSQCPTELEILSSGQVFSASTETGNGRAEAGQKVVWSALLTRHAAMSH